ncbi:unnamed protein product [Symbiodinium necroappetens]|uniref:Uncharacterized protein n=1 Tax=Symbiodinium necroappetens TaxID=1628268 RepID=A0A812PBS7_9DINO|nr:unnamed protein product [Symbiodinium necroappetens]
MEETPVKDGASQLSQLWEANSTVRRRAATYVMVKLPPSGRIDRACIDLNEEVLEPIIQELGTRVGVDALEEHVFCLYKLMKLALSGPQASALAWSLKRLVSVFKRSIARPHRPRSAVIRKIMTSAGIPVPARAAGDDDDESTDYHEDGDEGEEEEEMEEDPPMDIDLRPEDVVAEKAPDAPLLSLAPPLKKAKTECFEEGSAKAGAGVLVPATPSDSARGARKTAPVPEHRPPTEPIVAPTAVTTVVETATKTHGTPTPPHDGGRAAHKDRMKRLKAIFESGKKAKDEEAGLARSFHVILKLSGDVAECQACGLTGSIDMFNTMECTDNLETQVWDQDSQPPYDPLCKALSFEGAEEGTETSNPAPKDTIPDALISVGSPTRKTAASKKGLKDQEKHEADKGQEKPEACDKGQEKAKVCDKGHKEKAHPPKESLKPEAAEGSLPAKPACMDKIPASMSPDEQVGRPVKETAETDEEEQQEGFEDVEMAEGSEGEGDDDDGEQDLDGEEMEDEEGEESDEDHEMHEMPAKRPAGKIATKAPKAKAKAKGRGKGRGGAKGTPKAKAKAKGKAKAKAKAKSSSKKAPKGTTEDEMKKLKSRKSVAYHKARAEALAAGMSAEEASEIAKEAT